jgi:phosphoglycolate phosphatase-like HAD superfamily hydrolase
MTQKEKFKLVIFDFDGTIADSFDICFDGVNEIFEERGWKKVPKIQKEKARELSAKDVLKYFKVSNYQIAFIARKLFRIIERDFHKVKIFPELKKTLRALKKQDFKIVILTSNIKRNVEPFLEREEIKDLFDDYYYKSGIFSKDRLINKLVKKYKVKKRETILIGDEIRDIKASKKSRIKMIAVTWGFNNKKVLVKNNPNYIVDKPQEILEILIN